MILTYKYRLKDRCAAKYLAGHAFQCNQIWNWAVAQHRDVLDRYRAGAPKRKWLSHFDLAKTFKGYGKEIGLHQQTVRSICEQWSRNRSLKFRSSYGVKRALGWVPFQQQSRQIGQNSVTYLGKTFRFFGSKRRPLPADAKGGYFTEDSLGRWWVCFHVEVEQAKAVTGEVGVDLGLKNFATLSDGTKRQSPKSYRAMEAKLAVAQRAGNKRRVKALHIQAANIRRDFHHKLSRQLANDYAIIAVGNVSSSKLAQTRMAKSVLDAGWSAFRNILAYKASCFMEVDEKFTTQTCSECGSIAGPKGRAGLNKRSWDCPDCGLHHDRDVNSAKVILFRGLSAQSRVDESRRAA